MRIGRLADSDLVAWPIGSCTLLACAAPAYLSRCGRPESPGDLPAHERIGYIGTVSTTPWAFEALPIHAITPTARHVPQKVRAFRDRLTDAFGHGNAPWERWRKASPAGRARGKRAPTGA